MVGRAQVKDFIEMMDVRRKSRLRLNAVRTAGRAAIAATTSSLVAALFNAQWNWFSNGTWNIDWRFTIIFAAIMGIFWFAVMLLQTRSQSRSSASILDIQNRIPTYDHTAGRKHVLACGFVAMEYHFLILNRSFLIFICHDGLYGWKFVDTVDASNPLFFQPYADLLKDPDFMNNSEALRELSIKRGNFFIPRSEIVSVNVSNASKWGMGPIPHAGKLYITLASGREREFIPSGNVDGERIRQTVLSGVTEPAIC